MTFDQQIQIWNTVGTWLAGLATFAAVAVSLHLSRQASRVKLRASVSLRQHVERGRPIDEVLLFKVVNVGERPVTISSIGWVVGKGASRRYVIQLFGSPISASIPQVLAHGQRADFIVSFGEDPEWMERFATSFVESGTSEALASLAVEFHTTVEQSVTVKPDAAFLSRLSKVFLAKAVAK